MMSFTAAIEKKLMPVLLVDDSMADAALIAHAFEKEAVPNPLVHLKDGQAFAPVVRLEEKPFPKLTKKASGEPKALVEIY